MPRGILSLLDTLLCESPLWETLHSLLACESFRLVTMACWSPPV